MLSKYIPGHAMILCLTTTIASYNSALIIALSHHSAQKRNAFRNMTNNILAFDIDKSFRVP